MVYTTISTYELMYAISYYRTSYTNGISMPPLGMERPRRRPSSARAAAADGKASSLAVCGPPCTTPPPGGSGQWCPELALRYTRRHYVTPFLCFLVCFESFLVRMEFPCVVLWRPAALDCRVFIPPETWN